MLPNLQVLLCTLAGSLGAISSVYGAALPEINKRACPEVNPAYHNGNTMTCGHKAASTYTGATGGACGIVAKDEYYAAWHIPPGSVGAFPQCGKSVTLTNKNLGKKVTVQVVDKCESCDAGKTGNGATIDISPVAFQELFGMVDGVYDVEYNDI